MYQEPKIIDASTIVAIANPAVKQIGTSKEAE